MTGFRVSNGPLLWSAVVTLALAVLLGGAPIRPGWQFGLIFLSGLWTLCLAVWQGAFADFQRLPISARILVVAVAALPLLQIVPLPPGLWHGLPGRALEHEILDIVGVSNRWLPMSIEPLESAIAALMLVPMLGIFLASLRMTEDESYLLILVLLGLIILALFVGIAQVLTDGRLMALYRTAHSGSVLGFFANKNHTALMLALGISAGVLMVDRFGWRGPQAWLGVAMFALLLLAGLLGTGSRTGLLLGILALIVSIAAYVETKLRNVGKIALGSGGVLVIVAVLLSFSGTGGRVLERYEGVTTDLRWDIWQRSLAIVGDYLPFGAGIGSYANVYKKYEQIDWVIPVYINHAHSDYLEIAIEAGLPGLVLIALLWWIWVGATVRAAGAPRRGGRQIALFGSIGAGLILAHSLVDYPLRTAAFAVIFAALFAMLTRFRPAQSGLNIEKVGPAGGLSPSSGAVI